MKTSLYCFSIALVVSLSTSCSKNDVNDSRALDVSSLPVITTSAVTTISSSSGRTGGVISSDGGESVVSRGVCWNTSPIPTIQDAHTSNGVGTGSFTSDITGLSPNTTYYVRAYASNSLGTSYGNEISFTTSIVLSIGVTYQGGIVFYIDSTGMHGLICAPANQSDSADWGCPNVALNGADASSVGSGLQNTIDIIAGCPASIAAQVCDTLTLNGYTDWFLPSKGELALMYTNLHSAGLGGFSNMAYWSSTEMTASFAWQEIFTSGGIFQGTTKNNFIAVRAVREF
jgi:hypothetical protein